MDRPSRMPGAFILALLLGRCNHEARVSFISPQTHYDVRLIGQGQVRLVGQGKMSLVGQGHVHRLMIRHLYLRSGVQFPVSAVLKNNLQRLDRPRQYCEQQRYFLKSNASAERRIYSRLP